MSTSYLFSFAAKGLQSYIMRGGKLRDMVGATSLVDKLSTRQQFVTWLRNVFGVTKGFDVLQAAAGAARIRFDDKGEAESCAERWTLWCHAWAPDLDVVQDLREVNEGQYAQALANSGTAMERARNFPAVRLPEAGPFVKRAPRTGEPSVEVKTWKDRVTKAEETEIIDRSSERKRFERDALYEAKELPSVARAFGFKKAEQLPNDFEQVAGKERSYLAVIHADGNRVGQMFLNVLQALQKAGNIKDKTVVALLRVLSEDVVAEGTKAAAQTAMNALHEKLQPDNAPWPFAPIVLAGDDLTIVCRADLGVPFAEAFLKAFAEEMKNRLNLLRRDSFGLDRPGEKFVFNDLPEPVKNAVPNTLTAGAGIVFCTSHYPFSLAYELCESVAKQAKDGAKHCVGPNEPPPPALSFVRITGASAPTGFDEVTASLLRGSDGETLLTACPYFLEGIQQPQLSHLQEAANAAAPGRDATDSKQRLGLPSSSLRGLLNLLRTDIASVPDAVARMVEVAGGRGNDFVIAWKKLCSAPTNVTDWHHLRFFDAQNAGKSPLADLLTLLAVRDKNNDPRDSNTHKDAPP